MGETIMNLYFVRHAIAVKSGTEGYEDADRPLTEEGSRKMRKIARGLKAIGVSVDLIVSSPYTRARSTAEILARVLKVKKEIEFNKSLAPTGDPASFIAEMDKKYSVESLMIVGHEPYLSDLAGLLISETGRANVVFKKGGVCKLTSESSLQLKTAKLEWLLTPAMLAALSEK